MGRREGRQEVTTLRLISVPAQTTMGDTVQLTSGEALSSLEQTTRRMTEMATTLERHVKYVLLGEAGGGAEGSLLRVREKRKRGLTSRRR